MSARDRLDKAAARAAVALLLLCLLGCSTTHYARTIGKGNAAIDMSIGGPFVELFGRPTPIPLTTIGGTYGLTDRLDIHGHLHPTMAAYDLAAIDLGATWQLTQQNRYVPALATGGSLLVIKDVSSKDSALGCTTCVFPDLHLTASWLVGRHMVYGGVRGLVQTVPELAEGSPRVLLAPLIGGELRVGRFVGLGLEARWEVPYADQFYETVHYYGPGNYGGIAVLLGLNLHFDKHPNAGEAR